MLLLDSKKKLGDVIIIDDEKEVCEVVEAYLLRIGVFRNILKANDGNDALRKIKRQKFDLILLDMNIPKTEGIEIIKSVKDSPEFNNVKDIMIMSGTLDQYLLEEVMSLGVKDFLIKPFDKDKFTKRVEKYFKDKVS